MYFNLVKIRLACHDLIPMFLITQAIQMNFVLNLLRAYRYVNNDG